MERIETTREAFADGRIIELRQAADGDGIEEASVDEPFTQATEVRGCVFYQGLERCFSRGEVSGGIESDPFDVLESAAIAEENAEAAGLVASGGIGMDGEGRGKWIPGSGLWRLASASECGGDALEDIGLEGWGVGQG